VSWTASPCHPKGLLSVMGRKFQEGIGQRLPTQQTQHRFIYVPDRRGTRGGREPLLTTPRNGNHLVRWALAARFFNERDEGAQSGGLISAAWKNESFVLNAEVWLGALIIWNMRDLRQDPQDFGTGVDAAKLLSHGQRLRAIVRLIQYGPDRFA
jgi:hypothetical protein